MRDSTVTSSSLKHDLTGIRSLRIEALADPSMVKGGPGRAANGNFALTDFHVTACPSTQMAAAARPRPCG